MGWVTLAARKQSLRLAMSNLEMRDLQISRTLRSTQRTMAYEQSIIKNNKAVELRDIKETYEEVRDARPEDMQSEEYSEWYMEYQAAKEDYEAQRLEITEMYDDQLAMLEEEASDEEAMLQQEQTTVEAQLEAMQAEYRESVEYRVIEEKGPPHDRTFVVEVRFNDLVLGKGIGKSKKAAEQMAAEDALKKKATL